MSIRAKLLFALLLSAVLMLFLVWMQLSAAWQVRRQVSYFLPASDYLLAISSAQSAIASQMKEAVDYLLTADRVDLQEYEAHSQDVHTAFTRWAEAIRTQQQLGVEGEAGDLEQAYEILHRYSRWESGLEPLLNAGRRVQVADLMPHLMLLEQEIFPRFGDVLKDGFAEVEDSYRDLMMALGRLQPWISQADLAQLRAAHEAIRVVSSGHRFNFAVNQEFMALALYVLRGNQDDLALYRGYSRDAAQALEQWQEDSEKQTSESAAELYSTFRTEEYLSFRDLMNLAVARKQSGNDAGALALLIDRFDVMPGAQGQSGLHQALQSAGDQLVEMTKYHGQIGTLLMVLVLASLGTLLVLATRQIISRLTLLRSGFEQVGAGQLDCRVDLRGRDELADLAAGFNRMVEQVQVSRRKLAELNQDLEQRVAERTDQLQEKNRELEAFNAMVSHDLRSQLTVVDGFAQLLADQLGSLDADQARDLVDRIQTGSHRMQQIIESLHNLARMNADELNISPVDLSRMVADISRRLQLRDPERQVVFDITPGLVVAGDPGLLQIALENLLENAWKYTARTPEARIELGLQHDSRRPICFVRDNGVGFDPAETDLLFTPFRRLSSAEGFKGKGIGLSIVERVIERHGGEIWAEGRPGAGATFYFVLPWWQERQAEEDS